MYYEIHLTLSTVPDVFSVKTKCLFPYGWYFSQITGDHPQLGPAATSYATVNLTGDWPLPDVMDAMNHMAKILQENGCTLIRKRVEIILFDERITEH